MPPLHEPAPFLALALLAAIAGAYTAVLFRIPRVVGYLVAGLLLRWGLSSFFAGPQTEGALDQAVQTLSPIKSLALGMILFTLGTVFEARHVKSVGLRALRISIAEIVAVVVLVGAGCGLVWWIQTPADITPALLAGILLGIIGIATAPAATVLVVQECDARGPVSDVILSLTALNNLASIALFHTAILVLAATGMLGLDIASDRMLWLDLLLTTVGSAVLGGLLGFAFSVMRSQLSLSELFLMFFATLLALAAFDGYLSSKLHLSFNYLLTALFMGATFTNITANQEPLHDTISVLGKPLYATFFVLAGFELHVQDLAMIGAVGAAYVGLRVLGKYVGGRIGVRWARAQPDVRPSIGLGLLCQAGVAIGLVDFLARTWGTETADGFQPHAIASQLKTVILGSVVVFELTGPLVLRQIVVRSGEVKALTLLRRAPTAAPRKETQAAIQLSWGSLMRTIRGDGTKRKVREGNLTARHLMRSNVRTLDAAAGMRDVLYFVERSRDHNFPVVDDDGRLLGMIHFSDLRDILYDPTLSELVTAHDLARQTTPIVPVDLALRDLLLLFESTDVGSLPVVASRAEPRVVGMVEQRDVLKILHDQRKG